MTRSIRTIETSSTGNFRFNWRYQARGYFIGLQLEINIRMIENVAPIGRPPTTPSPHTDTCGSVWIWSGAGYYNPDGISWGSEQSRIDDATMGTEVLYRY